jgi:hypothetical protein
MYLGAEQAIGHTASWIISFEGLDSVKYDKDNTKIVSAGNEYNLLQYLKKLIEKFRILSSIVECLIINRY